MLVDWQEKYSKNGQLANSNLQIQCNPYQKFNSILCRVRIQKWMLTVIYRMEHSIKKISNKKRKKNCMLLQKNKVYTYRKHIEKQCL
jgi:hypothetical protein